MFTGDYAPATVTLTDERGLQVVSAATQIAPDTVEFTPDLVPLWKGAVTVSTPNGLQRGANYVTPAGFTTVNFGSFVSTPMSTANYPANSQATHPLTTNEGQALFISPDGHVEFDIGTYPQSADIAINDGTGYTPAQTQYFFDGEVLDLVSISVLVGAALDVDLVDFVPTLALSLIHI